ncbi:hypothetical protein [Kordia sp.]|uniref:hypothetical protein n=1 Tax=Kordia sp. TaxID=1965332 RepID=UPI003D2B95DD
MKKAKLKSCSLKKETISNFNLSKVKGGISYQPGCDINTTPPGVCHSFGQQCDQTIGFACNSFILRCP